VDNLCVLPKGEKIHRVSTAYPSGTHARNFLNNALKDSGKMSISAVIHKPYDYHLSINKEKVF